MGRQQQGPEKKELTEQSDLDQMRWIRECFKMSQKNINTKCLLRYNKEHSCWKIGILIFTNTQNNFQPRRLKVSLPKVWDQEPNWIVRKVKWWKRAEDGRTTKDDSWCGIRDTGGKGTLGLIGDTDHRAALVPQQSQGPLFLYQWIRRQILPRTTAGWTKGRHMP